MTRRTRLAVRLVPRYRRLWWAATRPLGVLLEPWEPAQ